MHAPGNHVSLRRWAGALLLVAALAQACGGGSSRTTGPSGNSVVLTLRGIRAAQVPGNCTGTLTATNTSTGVTQTFPIPPTEHALSLAAGVYNLVATLLCGTQTATGSATVRVVPPTPLQVSVVVAGVNSSLIVIVVGNGSVGSSPGGISCPGDCSEPFTLGTVVTLNASSGFVSYSGGGCSTNPTCNVTITSTPTTVIATFGGTGTVIVVNTADYACCTIPTVTFSPGTISPVSDLDPGESVTRGGVAPGSYSALWCGPTKAFTVNAGGTTTVSLDGVDCG